MNGDDYARFAFQALQSRPGWQALDAYKFLHQATCGPGHAVNDIYLAIQRIEDELNELWDHVESDEGFDDQSPTRGLWEPLSPDGLVGRLHLDCNQDAEQIAEAFWESAQIFQPDYSLLESACQSFGKNAHLGREWDDLLHLQKMNQWRPVSHSSTYRLVYKPAYRVMLWCFASVILNPRPEGP